MDILAVFGIISAIIFLGYISELIFQKTKIPDVLLLILLGIAIGSILKWANADTFGFGSTIFTTFALIFILFQGALSIDFRTLMNSLPRTLSLTIISFILTVSIILLIALIFQFDLMTSILIGMILGGTSSAVVIPLVNNAPIKDKYGLVLTLESAVSDVLCIIGTITILEIMTTGEVIGSSIIKTILSSFSLALVVGFLVGLFWISLMYKYDDLPKSYLLSIAVVIGLYAFVESPFVGGSGAIAAVTFGLVLGNSRSLARVVKKPKKDETIRNVLLPSAKNFYTEISFFVKTFFFVYLGILIDFSNPSVFAYGILLTIGIFLVRPLAVKLVFRNDVNISHFERTYLEILIPKGLAAAVLAGIAVQSGVLNETIVGSFVNIILSTVFLSILMTSILIFITEKKWFNGFMPFLHGGKVDK